MTLPTFKPSEVRMWRGALPLIATFGRAETEFAAALLVIASVKYGDEWKARTPQDIGTAMKEAGQEGGVLHHLHGGPIPHPDFRALAEQGFAEFLGDPDEVGVPVQFTDKGYEMLKRTVERRAPVQGDGNYTLRLDDSRRGNAHYPGTVSWAEHCEAWTGYEKRYSGSARDQDAERIAQRGGFGYDEMTEYLGHEPTTWRVHPQYEGLTATMRAFIGAREAFRKLGYPAADLRLEIARSARHGGVLSAFCHLTSFGKTFSLECGPVKSETAAADEYKRVCEAINSGALSQADLDRIWQESEPYRDKVGFATALMLKGFSPPRGVS